MKYADFRIVSYPWQIAMDKTMAICHALDGARTIEHDDGSRTFRVEICNRSTHVIDSHELVAVLKNESSELLADCGVLSVELADDAIDVFFTPIEDMPASVSMREMGAGHWRLSLLA